MESKLIDVSLVGMRTHKHPPGMENWRYFRIEYGGFRHETIAEEGVAGEFLSQAAIGVSNNPRQ